MAKLKAPLMSLGASGALGKALVFFGWKGLNVVREYVVPANPKSTEQQIQRGYLTVAVALVHAAQAHAVNFMLEADIRAMALWGSTFATPRTWFNQMVKNLIDQQVAGKKWGAFCHGSTGVTDTTITFVLKDTGMTGGAVTTGAIWYGSSKTALIKSISADGTQMAAGKVITGLVSKTKYFMQYRPTIPVGYLGLMSGIYYDKTE